MSNRYIFEMVARSLIGVAIIVAVDGLVDLHAPSIIIPIIVGVVTVAGAVVIAIFLWIDVSTSWSCIAILGRSRGCKLTRAGMLVARNLGLSSLNQIRCHADLVPKITIIDVTNNAIRDFQGLARFKNVQRIYFDHNLVQSMKGFPNMQALSFLSIQHNKIGTRPTRLAIHANYNGNPFMTTAIQDVKKTQPVPENHAPGSAGRALPPRTIACPPRASTAGRSRAAIKNAAARAAREEREEKEQVAWLEQRRAAERVLVDRVARAERVKAAHVPTTPPAVAAEIAAIKATPFVGNVPSGKGPINHHHVRNYAKALVLMKAPCTTLVELCDYFKIHPDHAINVQKLLHELCLAGVVVMDAEIIVFLTTGYAIPPWSRFNDEHVKAFHVDAGNKIAAHTPGHVIIAAPVSGKAPVIEKVSRIEPVIVKSTIGFKVARAAAGSSGGVQASRATAGARVSVGGKSSTRGVRHKSTAGPKRKESDAARREHKEANLNTRARGMLVRSASTGAQSVSMDAVKTSTGATEGRRLAGLKAYLVKLERQQFIRVEGSTVVLLPKLRHAPIDWVSPDKFVRRKLDLDRASSRC